MAKIRGIVESSDENRVKLGGKWYGLHIERIPKPEEGTEVEIETRKGVVRKLSVIKTATEISPDERHQILEGFTEFVETVCGNLYVTVNTIEGKPFEILVCMGEPDHGLEATCETVGRLVSLALRSGASVKTVSEELQSIDKSSSNGAAVSIPEAVAQILIRNFADEPSEESENLIYFDDCPNCNTERSLVFQSGCSRCHICGFTDCY